MKIKKIKVVLEDKIIETGVEIEDGVIKSLNCNEGEDLSNYYLIPGLIDQHIHGSANSDAMDGTIADLENIAISLLKEGTTSFLATTMTEKLDKIQHALDAVINYDSKKGANILGVHLEGPFINKSKKGAQKEENIINPSIDILSKLNNRHVIKLITIAPEEEHALETMDYCVKQDIVVSIGHTSATYDETMKAVEHGASQVTHMFNAMTAFSHREVGVIGAVLLSDKLKAELICDGIHVSKEAINILYNAKHRENIILITDAMRAKNINGAESELGGQKVFIKDNSARLADGTLAGSILRSIDGVKNIMKFTGCSLVDAVYMASTSPAKNLNIYDKKGSIALNKDADLVILDADLNIYKTIVNGIVKYEKGIK